MREQVFPQERCANYISKVYYTYTFKNDFLWLCRGHDVLRRYTAASQLLTAFMSRTMAYKLNHRIGLVLFSDKILETVAPCEVSHELLVHMLSNYRSIGLYLPLVHYIQEKTNFQKAGGQTKLYDAMMTAAHQLIESTKDFPYCQK